MRPHGSERKQEGLLCWKCSRPTGVTTTVTRHDQCQQCQGDLRCCRGCRHFDPTKHRQCREQIQNSVANKEKSNFCDFFQVRQVYKTAGGTRTHADDKETRRDAFDDLFKD
jgi:hypothetical protein